MSADLEPTSTTARPRITAQVLFGLIVIVVGIIFTLANLGIIEADQYLSYWPAGLVAVGLLKLWQARDGHGIFGGLFMVVVGGWMLLEHIAVIRIDIRDVWPLFLVFLGGYLMFKGFGGGRRTSAADSTAHITALAIMAGVVRRSSSTAFEGGDLTAIMGGCDIDLRRASIAGDEAVIDVFAFWGGIELKVPQDWHVVGRVTPLMGGYEDKTQTQPAQASKRLVIRGLAIMGGIDVKN